MTLQPAPGAGVVRRDAHTIPPREPRDGRRIGTPISAEEPQFDASRFWRLVFAVGRNLASYFVSQRAARTASSLP